MKKWITALTCVTLLLTITMYGAFASESESTSLVTKEAPDFTAQAIMPDNSITDLTLSSYRGEYVVLFFYPLDFTFVCPSEIIAFNKDLKKFKDRNTAVIGVSVDSPYTHYAWRHTQPENGGIGQIGFPLVADLNKKISRQYGVLFDESVALRGLFLIDKQGVVRHQVVNDLPLGRNVAEAIRMVDALQFTEEHGEVCPANWELGKEGMKPTAEGVAEYLKKHAE
ncbi:MAG: peroxiredoxin (thioredoxin peroxidase) [Candidatus Scalindua rubra]|uniref:Thioredoxin peroxidase n=1 Tax=Candidatus Scalindua rubra TaxID=1872076 RepID=A0A1E3X9Q3_9BACT|nr:MAG: peroxiredoxin (thioredoxin peroxidase) [Candidatus Scalindua rubra]